MRLRNVKNANDIIEKSRYVISNPRDYKGRWHTLFNNHNSIHVEIGMGKGKFIKDMALANPNINFIGIEKYSSVIVKALKLIDEYEICNLKIICIDALLIDNIFDHEISHLYLNFSDPWPKDRHAKRRLTSNIFMSLYDKILVSNKRITQKTDNYNLYIYSKEQFLKYNYSIEDKSYTLNNIPKDNISTEYEDKFLLKGNIIYLIDASK